MGSRPVSARLARQDRARRDVVLPLSGAVTAALQAYADRGVFRGFRAAAGPGGRIQYDFAWLLGRPVRAVFDPARRVLTFPSLFPGVGRPGTPMVAALDAHLRSRTGRALPAHKRLDARRSRASSSIRRGDWSLALTVPARDPAYAVRGALNLINDLFLALQERWPEYLIERFGLSAE